MDCYLEFKSPNSEKFWAVTTTGNVVNTRWGKLGTEGRKKSTEHPSEALAEADANKQIQSKLKKGYVVAAGSVAMEGPVSAPAFRAWKPIKFDAELISEMRDPDILRDIRKLRGGEVDKLKALLDGASDGLLTVSEPLGVAEILYLFYMGYGKIKEIRSDSWQTFDQYIEVNRISVEALDEYLGTEAPRDYWRLKHYWDCYYRIVGNSFDVDSVWLKGFDSPEGVFSAVKLDEKALLLNRYGHHEPNYFPTFHYGSDGVTHGFVYDLQEKGWAPIVAYHGDGYFEGDTSLWECIYKELEDLVEGEFFLELDDLVSWKDFTKAVKALDEFDLFEICAWIINLTLTAFLNQSEIAKFKVRRSEKARFGDYLSQVKIKDSKDKVLIQTIYPNVNLSVAKNFPDYLTKNDVELLDAMYSAGPRFNELGMARRFGELSDSARSEIFASEMPSSVEEFFTSLDVAASRAATEGMPWLATIFAFGYWDCMDKASDKRALAMLDCLDESQVPEFIKSVFKLHAESRYDESIHA